jgi:hypothetical protein
MPGSGLSRKSESLSKVAATGARLGGCAVWHGRPVSGYLLRLLTTCTGPISPDGNRGESAR